MNKILVWIFIICILSSFVSAYDVANITTYISFDTDGNDSSGNDLDINIAGSTTAVTSCKINGCYRAVRTSTEGFDYPDVSALKFKDDWDFSISLWVNFSSTQDGANDYWLSNTNDGATANYIISRTKIGGYTAYEGNNGNFLNPVFPVAILDDTWHHIVLSYESGATDNLTYYNAYAKDDKLYIWNIPMGDRNFNEYGKCRDYEISKGVCTETKLEDVASEI